MSAERANLSAVRPRGQVPPHNLDAEEALLGAMLLSLDACDRGIDMVDAGDFYKPAHGHIFHAIAACRANGGRPDAVLVGEHLRVDGLLDQCGGSGVLLDLQAATPAISNAGRYAATVHEHAMARRTIGWAAELIQAAYDGEDVIAMMREGLSRFDGSNVDVVPAISISDFLARPGEHVRPWLIPDLIREQWRVMLVGGEGVGKYVVIRQILMAAARGRHPFNLTRQIDPVRCVQFDLENPPDAIDAQLRLSIGALNSVLDVRFDPATAVDHLVTIEQGIDIRTTRGRRQLEQVIGDHHAQLAGIGPLYKLGLRRRKDETMEEAAMEVADVLDQVRTRHGCALLIEHHAPKAQGGKREMDPFGSSVWMRWPEIGLGIKPVGTGGRPEDALEVTRFRGDRSSVQWPDRLERTKDLSRLPWEGIYPTGYWSRPAPRQPFGDDF
jgi:hypothetical protein